MVLTLIIFTFSLVFFNFYSDFTLILSIFVAGQLKPFVEVGLSIK